MKKLLTTSDWRIIQRLLAKASLGELYEIQDSVQKEIRLGETAKSEGFEN